MQNDSGIWMSMGKLDDYILKIIPEFIGKIPPNRKKRLLLSGSSDMVDLRCDFILHRDENDLSADAMATNSINN